MPSRLESLLKRFFPPKLVPQRVTVPIVMVLFAVIGVVTVNISQASTINIPLEAESGTVAGNAKTNADPLASGGSGVLFGATVTPPDVPLPNPAPEGTLVNAGSNKCLDVEDGNASSDSAIRIMSCNGSAAQKWAVAFTDSGYLELRALGMCLANKSTNGQVVDYLSTELETCDGRPKQKWLVDKTNGKFINTDLTQLNKKDICLDVKGSGTDDETEVGAFTCAGNDAQKWALPAANSPYSSWGFAKYVSNTSKCVDLPSGITTPGTVLQIWDCNDQDPQGIFIGHDGTGRVKMTILGQCFETQNGGVTDGTKVQIGACSNSTAQNWEVMSSGNTGSFKHKKSGKCLDTESGAIANSVQLVIKTCSPSAPGQQFTS